jgi:hypothetical protein
MVSFKLGLPHLISNLAMHVLGPGMDRLRRTDVSIERGQDEEYIDEFRVIPYY